MGAQLNELRIHKMKHYATIMHEVEEAYGLTWKDVYNILYSDERESDKIMLLETNFMTNKRKAAIQQILSSGTRSYISFC